MKGKPAEGAHDTTWPNDKIGVLYWHSLNRTKNIHITIKCTPILSQELGLQNKSNLVID